MFRKLISRLKLCSLLEGKCRSPRSCNFYAPSYKLDTTLSQVQAIDITSRDLTTVCITFTLAAHSLFKLSTSSHAAQKNRILVTFPTRHELISQSLIGLYTFSKLKIAHKQSVFRSKYPRGILHGYYCVERFDGHDIPRLM